MATTTPTRLLSIYRGTTDGKFYCVGSVYEEEVHKRLVQGFDRYHEVVDYMESKGYGIFNGGE